MRCSEIIQAMTSSPRVLLRVLLLGVFMAALDSAVIGPAIPAIRAEFGINHREVGWVMSSFILFSLTSTVLMSNLSDRIGRRPVFLSGIALFAVGSALIAGAGFSQGAGLIGSHGYAWLIVGRILQGMGSGGIVPTASAVIGDALPTEQQGKALGLIGAVYGMAFVLGPPLAGALTVWASWPWIFLINLPLAFYLLLAGAKALPKPLPQSQKPPLDWLGLGLFFSALMALLLGVTQLAEPLNSVAGSEAGAGSGAVAVAAFPLWPWAFASALVLTGLFVLAENRASQRGQRAMVPMVLFTRPRLVLTYGLTLGSGLSMGGIAFLASMATQGFGVSTPHAGFVLLPLVLFSMISSMGSGRLLNRLGARVLVVTGFAALTLGYAGTALAALLHFGGLIAFLCFTAVVGLGVGILVGGALRSVALQEAPDDLRATAQGLINLFNGIGSLVATAAISGLADALGDAAGYGFSVAYLGLGLVMLALWGLALRLPAKPKASP